MSKSSTTKRWVPTEGPLHNKPKRDAAALLRAQVLDVADAVFDRYVDGESYVEITKGLPFQIQPWKLRDILHNSDETKDRFKNASLFRAHALVEAAIDYGKLAAANGDSAGLRAAIDVNLKVASKMAPAEYGDTKKVELTGKDGGALEVKADLTLTAEQAYERLIKGK